MAERRLILVARSQGIYLCRGLWKVLKWTWGVIFVGGGVGLISSWLVMPFGSIFSNTPIGVIYEHLDITLKVISGYALFTIIVWRVSLLNPSSTSSTSSRLTPTQTDRHALIRLLRREYSKRLAQSLHGQAMIVLNLHERIDIIRSSAELVFHRIDRAHEAPLPSGTSVVQAYDDAGPHLLLLGAPGAGKTTFLLALVGELLIRAEVNHTHPIPVILNLSSWTSKKTSLAIWLIEQLSLIYGVPSNLSQMLLEQDQWLLLFDGLDEVAAEVQNACIETINLYRREHLAPLVICSRSYEYLTQEGRLGLSSALIIQPLQQKQITEYLEHLGKPMEALRVALDANTTFRQLLTTPLMLSIVITTYRDPSTEALLRKDAEKLQHLILERYVQQMLRHSIAKERISPQQMQLWLAWLAQQMQLRHLTEFYLEQLQFSWLPTKWAQIVCLVLSGLYVGSVSGSASGLIAMLFVGPLDGLASGLAIGLLSTIPLIFINKYPHIKFDQVIWGSGWTALRLRWIIITSLGLVLGLTDGVVFGTRLGWRIGLISGLISWLLVTLASWLLVTLASWLLSKLSVVHQEALPKISPNEVLRWSWKGGWFGLPAILAFGLLSISTIGPLQGAFVGFLGGLAIALITGLSSDATGKIRRVFPNQGVYSSGWNALWAGLTIGLTAGVAATLYLGWRFGQPFGLIVGLLAALAITLRAGWRFGGNDYFAHYLLRYLLWCSGAMPLRYVRFLEEMRERILLQRVGGGYRFIHPLFQEYFASLPTGASSSPPAQPPSSQP